jgi:hypothetical protein
MARGAIVAAALVLAAAAAQAGRSCENRPPTVAAIQRSMALAEHAARALDQSGAQVVVLARIGQNLSQYHLRYSHLGFAYRDADQHWRIVHKLNQCGSANGSIYRQGLGEFFLDDLYEYEAAIVVPRPDVQARLLPALQDNARVAQLNTPAYSMVAYPWAQTYQQSNQWAIETLAMTQEPAAQTRSRAQAWLQLQGYQPTTLRIGPLQRLGGRLTAANIAFDDHPNAKRFSDRIETVTVDSVFAWLNRSGLGGPVQVIR